MTQREVSRVLACKYPGNLSQGPEKEDEVNLLFISIIRNVAINKGGQTQATTKGTRSKGILEWQR